MARGANGELHRADLVSVVIPFDHPLLARRVRDWTDAHQVYKAVMSFFGNLPGPPGQRRATSRILYRIDDRRRRIVLQAATPFTRVGHGAHVANNALPTQVENGCMVRFRLDVNAVRCQHQTGRRIPVPDKEISGWLAPRLSPALKTITIVNVKVTYRRTGHGPVRIARLTGTACVGDKEALLALIHAGVGRAKAYGCGLLSVQPAAE